MNMNWLEHFQKWGNTVYNKQILYCKISKVCGLYVCSTFQDNFWKLGLKKVNIISSPVKNKAYVVVEGILKVNITGTSRLRFVKYNING